ncbi:MAG: SIS domain-containing protein [Gammaproteobacteria bacterium]
MRSRMDYFGMTQASLERAGGYWTAREILQQPGSWVDIERLMARDAPVLRSYLDPLLRRADLRIVLTGAGTSASVGDCLAPALLRAGRAAQAVSTTDLVGSPDSWLPPAAPILLVSFARSGDSPESVAALKLAEQAAPDCHHLIVTCNRDGALYRWGQDAKNAHVVLLPEETNDRGFAMTSSFSGMLLAVAQGFGLLPETAAAALARWGAQVLESALPLAASLAGAGFERVVYLGSNECKGLAREAALKMLELSDGRVVTLCETPLGFRHGPKTIVNGKTLVVMFLSNDRYTRRYEMDVLNELRADGVAARVVALSAEGTEPSSQGDEIIVAGAMSAPNIGMCLPFVAFAQVLAFLQSLALGLTPDSPNAKGVVNRVVPGFTIYPWDAKR